MFAFLQKSRATLWQVCLRLTLFCYFVHLSATVGGCVYDENSVRRQWHKVDAAGVCAAVELAPADVVDADGAVGR